MDVLNAALWVDDVPAMKRFYEDGLGLEGTREFVGGDGATNYFLAGESNAEIQFKYHEDDPEGVDAGSVEEADGFDHLGIAVDDVDARVDALADEFDSELVRGPQTLADKGIRIAFVTDPDGYVVELIERLEE